MQRPPQSDESFDSINLLIWKHLEDRDWLGGSLRSYASSISIEAAELLEHFQWSETPIGDKEALASELADILIYCFQFAQHADIDMTTAIKKKLAESALKYPIEDYKGKDAADRRKNWLQAKKTHRAQKEGL